MKSRWSRRDFLKSTAALMALGAADGALGASPSQSALPKRRLGKTGEMVSCIGFGSGTRFCSIQDEDAAQALLERAFALGINYFDTAGSYTRRPLERLSEKRLGEFSKKRRKEIFLATKIDPRDRDGALRSVETSLKFLQTDYLDLIQIHSLSDLNDLDRIGSANGVLAAIQQLKDQKVSRFIGITGHNDGAAMTEALRRHDFDTVLMALNAAQSANPVAAAQDGADPRLRAVRIARGAAKEHGDSLHESHGPGNAGRQRRRPRLASGAFTVQPEPARRLRRHRLRADGSARRKRPGGAQFHADERKRETKATRKSRPVALGVAAFLASRTTTRWRCNCNARSCSSLGQRGKGARYSSVSFICPIVCLSVYARCVFQTRDSFPATTFPG